VKKFKILLSVFALTIGATWLISCSDDDEPTCTPPTLTTIFIGSGSSFTEMTSTGSNTWEYSITNFSEASLTFVFANNATGANATYGAATGTTTFPTTGIAVEKVVDGSTTCGNNVPFVFSNLNGKNITITFNSATRDYSITSVDFNPCTDFSKERMFIRWRNTSDAANFSWAEMTKVAGAGNIFQITQPASVFYLPDADAPNFGAQILEFSNQPDYGGNLDGELWPLYRNKDCPENGAPCWTFAAPVDGVTSQTAYYVSVSTRNAEGVETIVCPKPADAGTTNRGFRLFFTYNSVSIFAKTNTLRYVIDADSGEVAVFIQ